MKPIHRQLSVSRYADLVIHRGVARWVEVPEDASAPVAEQLRQIFSQIDQTLNGLGTDKSALLEVVIYLADLRDVVVLNALWDAWVDRQHPPIRACVGVDLQAGYLAEFILTAAVDAD